MTFRGYQIVKSNFAGQLSQVQAEWFDVNYFDGECSTERRRENGGDPPRRGKNFLSYATDHRICFIECQRARNKYMVGCEFNAETKICYSHTSNHIEAGNGLANSKCMIFLTMSEKPGECVYYPGQQSTSTIGDKNRVKFGDLREARKCLDRCLQEQVTRRLEDTDPDNDIAGCEFRFYVGQDHGYCHGIIADVFQGGSGAGKPQEIHVCWKIVPDYGGAGLLDRDRRGTEWEGKQGWQGRQGRVGKKGKKRRNWKKERQGRKKRRGEWRNRREERIF